MILISSGLGFFTGFSFFVNTFWYDFVFIIIIVIIIIIIIIVIIISLNPPF